MSKKLLLVIFLLISITCIPIKSFAIGNTEKQIYTISIEDAYARAINANNDFNKNDKSIYNMIKHYGATKVIHDRSQYSMASEFERLYERLKSGKYLQSYEQGELVMYYAAFKDSEIFINKSLKPTIDPYNFPFCDIWVSMMKMKINNELIRKNTIESVRQLFDSLIALQENISIMSENNKILELEYNEADQNYENGKISELQRANIISNYEIQKLELSKVQRNKENAERNLKRYLAIDLNDEIQIIPYKVLDKEIVIPSYKSCIKRALLNRNEIALVKMNLIATQNKLAVINKYLEYWPVNTEFQLSKQETLLKIKEIQNEIEVQEGYVTKELNKVYADVDYQNKTISIERIKLQTAQKDLDKTKLQYKSGGVSSKTLAKVELEYKKENNNYQRALRELTGKVTKLSDSCGV